MIYATALSDTPIYLITLESCHQGKKIEKSVNTRCVRYRIQYKSELNSNEPFPNKNYYISTGYRVPFISIKVFYAFKVRGSLSAFFIIIPC